MKCAATIPNDDLSESVTLVRSKRRIPELDGLRGIAILLVMAFHFVKYRPPTTSIIHSIIFRSIDLGWTGVDLFFVLSGFLITGILLDSKGSPGFLKVFYTRRSLRILPLYYLGILFSFWIAPYCTSRFLHWNWPPGSTEQIWYWLHIANWRTAFYPLIYPIATHFWSLAVEEQFYLFWPIVVLGCSRSTLLRVSLFGIFFAWFLRNLSWAQALSAAYPNSLYRLTPFRMDVLLIGACAAIVIRDGRMLKVVSRWIVPMFLTGCTAFAFVLLAAGSMSPHSAPMTRFGFTALGLIFVSAVLYGATGSGHETGVHRFLRLPFLRHFGKYSYAMYVFHALVITFLPRLPVETWGGLPSGLFSLVTGIAVTDLVARVSWFAFESRFLQLGDRIACPGLNYFRVTSSEQ